MLCFEMYTIVCETNESTMGGGRSGGRRWDALHFMYKGSLLCHQIETISNCRF